jgi:hypothetical protein
VLFFCVPVSSGAVANGKAKPATTPMLTFTVEFADHKIDVRATGPVKAFEKALQLHPDKRPIRAVCQSRLAGKGSFPQVSIAYDVPRNLKLRARPPEAAEAEQQWLPGLEK